MFKLEHMPGLNSKYFYNKADNLTILELTIRISIKLKKKKFQFFHWSTNFLYYYFENYQKPCVYYGVE